MTMLSNLDLIRRVPLFSMLTEAQAMMVADVVGKKRFKRRELIVEQGMRCDELFIMLNGRARVYVAGDEGGEITLSILRPGDYLGEMSLIDNQPHSANVQAEAVTDVLVLDRMAFARCLPDPDSMAYGVIRGLVRRLRAANQKITSLALMDVYGRVAKALLDLASEDDSGQLLIQERVSRQDIAKMVGASREMVSRVMKDLEAKSMIVKQEDGRLWIHDRLDGV